MAVFYSVLDHSSDRVAVLYWLSIKAAYVFLSALSEVVNLVDDKL